MKNEEAKRIRKCRAKLKMLATAHVAEEQPALFANRQSFGKAVKKVKSKLPESPRKRKAVLAKLAEDAGISFTESPPSKSKKPGPKENKEIDAAAIAFYSNDDISWQAPGRKDRVIYRSRDANGKKHKEYVQCRYMLMSLGEAHQLAVTTGLMISRSKITVSCRGDSTENCSITTGDFVVVQHESKRNSRKNYIAQVIEIDNEADLHKVINMR